MTNTDPRIISITRAAPTPAPITTTPAPTPAPTYTPATLPPGVESITTAAGEVITPTGVVPITTPAAPTTAEVIAADGTADPRIYSITTAEGEQVFNPANPEVQAAMAAGITPSPIPEITAPTEGPLPPELTYDVQDPLQVALAQQRAEEEFLRSKAETLRISASQIAAAGAVEAEPTIQKLLAEAAALERRLPAEAVSAAARLQQMQFQPTLLPSLGPTAQVAPGRPPIDQALALAYSVQDTLNAGRGALLVQAEQTAEGEWIVGYSAGVGYISPAMEEQLRNTVSEFQQRLYPNTEITQLEDGRYIITSVGVPTEAPTTITEGVQTFGEGGIQPTLGDEQLYGGYTYGQLQELFPETTFTESAIGQVLVSEVPTEELKVGTYTVAITPTSLFESQEIDETTGVEAESFTKLTPAPVVEGTSDRLIDVAATQAALEAQGFTIKEIKGNQVILEKDILAETAGKEISLELLPIGQRDISELERRPLASLTPEERELVARETALDVAYQQERLRLGAAAGIAAPGAIGQPLISLTAEEQRELGLKLKAAQYKEGLPGTLLAREESITKLVEREATLEELVRQTGIPGVVGEIESAFKQYGLQEITAEEPIAQLSGRIMTTAGEVISGTAEAIGGIATQTLPLVITIGEEKATQLREVQQVLAAPTEEGTAKLQAISEEELVRLGRISEFGKTIGERGYEWVTTIPERPGEASRELITTAGTLLLTGVVLGGALYGAGKAAQYVRTKAVAFQQARTAADISRTAYTGGIYAGAEFPRPFQYVQVTARAAGGPILAPPTRFIAPTPTIAGPGIAAETGRAVSTGKLVTARGTYEVFVPSSQYTLGAGPAITYPVPTPLVAPAPFTPATFGATYTYRAPAYGVAAGPPSAPIFTYTGVRGAQILPDISRVSPKIIIGRAYTPQVLGYQPLPPVTAIPTYSYTLSPFTYTDVGLISGQVIITSPKGEIVTRDFLGTTLARETGRGEGIYRVTGQYIAGGQPPAGFTQYITTEPLTLQQELGKVIIAEQPTYAIRDYGLTLTEAAGPSRGVISGVYFQEIPTGVAPRLIEAGGTLTYISPGFEYGKVATVTFGGAVGAPGVTAIIEPSTVAPIVSPGAVTTFVPIPAEGGMQLGMLQRQQLITPPPTTQAVIRGVIETEVRRAATELAFKEIAASYVLPTAESLAATGAAAGITAAGIQEFEVPVTVSATEARAPPISLEKEVISPIEKEVQLLTTRIPSALTLPSITEREFVVTRERPLAAQVEVTRAPTALRERPIQRMADLEDVVVAQRPIAVEVTRPALAEVAITRPAITPLIAEKAISIPGLIERYAVTQRPLQEQVYRPLTTTTTITTTTRVPPPVPAPRIPFIPIPFPLPGRPDIKPKKMEKPLAFRRRKPELIARRPRGILSDLLSLQRSQIFYGAATSPSVLKRPEIFEYEERYPIGKVPTVEELEYGIIRKKLIDGKLRKTLKRYGMKLRRRART